MKARARLVLALFVVGAPLGGIAACVLADPPPLVQIPPPTRPVILHDSVSPPLDQKLLAPPGQSLDFVVPVQVDPDQAVQWRVFVDLDPNGSPNIGPTTGGVDDGGVLGTTPAEGGSIAVREEHFSLTAGQIDLGACHTITFVVAYSFQPLLPASPVDPPGGDRATWFYEPMGDCTYFDAAPPTDAGTADGPAE